MQTQLKPCIGQRNGDEPVLGEHGPRDHRKPSEGRTYINGQVFGEHHPIDTGDAGQVRYWADRLKATPEEICEAVGTVGPNCTAVAIWLGSPQAI